MINPNNLAWSPRRFGPVALAAAFLGLSLAAGAQQLSNVWKVAAGSRPYLLAASDGQRGVGASPVSGNVVVVSRVAATNAVYVLDGATGSDVGILNPVDPVSGVSLITGGTFVVNAAGVADDGAVYVGNLTTSTVTPNLRIYRWSTDSVDPTNTPVLAFAGDPASGTNSIRWGDAMAVRGSGTNTEILVTSALRFVTLLRTADGTNFTPTHLTITNIASGNPMQRGVAWADGNSFWGKDSGSGAPLRRLRYDLGTRNAWVERTIATTAFPADITTLGYLPTNGLLAGMLYSAGNAPVGIRLFDASYYNAALDPIAFAGTNSLSSSNVNGNRAGGISFSGTNRIVYLSANNGLAMDQILFPSGSLPPTISGQPASTAVYSGASNVVFTVGISGVPPFGYRWFFQSNFISNATNSSYTVPLAVDAAAGAYHVVVTNFGGAVTSVVANLTLLPTLNSTLSAIAWELPAGSKPYLSTSDSSQRSLAFNPATSNLLVVSRAQTNAVIVLNALTGAEKHGLAIDASVVSGGTFALNQIAVTDDGVVLGANLTTAAASPLFNIYRWDNDGPATAPLLVGQHDPGAPTGIPADQSQANIRWGDAMAVRGAYTNSTVEVILAPSTGTNIAILRPDGSGFFSPDPSVNSLIRVSGAVSGFAHLGIAWGPGTNTFWAKGSGSLLRLVEYDFAARTGLVVRAYSTTSPLSVPLASSGPSYHPGLKLLGVVAIESPDNARLYDVSDLDLGPVFRDQELFGTDNANVNNTTASAFGAGKFFALSSNNGLIAMNLNNTFNPGVPVYSLTNQFAVITNLVSTNNSVIVRWPSVPARVYRVESKDDLSLTNWTPVTTVSAPAATTVVTNIVDGVTNRVYRVRAL